jgi:uncharacterized protein
VYPAAKRTSVGGRYGSSDPAVLMVRVTAPAVEGKANEAVLTAVSAAFRLARRNVRIVSGANSRTKVLDLEGADQGVLAALLAAKGE